MRIFPPFREDRREDLMRRAEMKIYDLLAASAGIAANTGRQREHLHDVRVKGAWTIVDPG